jgi:hypothetical protein
VIDLYGNLGVWTTAVIGLRDREEIYQLRDLGQIAQSATGASPFI